MATTAGNGNRSAARLTQRLVLATALALMIVGLTGFGTASAQTFKNGTISVSQHEYVGICKDLGGTPSRAGARKVKCDMGDGYSSTCDFKTNKCEDTIPMLVPDQGQFPGVNESSGIAPERSLESGQKIEVQPVQVAPVYEAPVGGHDGSGLDPIGN